MAMPQTLITRRLAPLVICATALFGATSAARAQTSGTPVNLAPTQAVDAPPVEHLFGDWGGLQPYLQSQGVNVQLDAITEFAGNVSGGTNQGATFANQVGLNNDINWERLAGLTGLSTHVIIVSRSGANDSALFGDNLLPVQEIYGSGGNVVLHLVSAFAQETLFDKALDIAAGRMNVENDFASSPLYCNYMNNDLCGDPKALPGGDIGHSAYPDAAWALRVRVRPTPDTYIESGVYQVNQGMYSDANFRTGFKFDDSQTSGVYLPVEIAWEPKLGADQMPGHYKLGFGYDTSSGYQDFANVLATDGVPGYRQHTRTGNTQVWALFDQMLVRQGSSDKQGIIALAGFIDNDPNHTSYAQQYFLGVIDGGFWQARPEDSINLLFTYVTASGPLGKVQAIEQSLGLPFSGSATGIQNHEIALEANYNLHVFRGVDFQPDFQYIIQPNAQANIKDAAVFGFRANVQF
ncbi:MAG TPA: carbohydrate porin [Acetobacteraceae bacterium]|nr:carbohydrate porin [Acetobacteraceae bacterium]